MSSVSSSINKSNTKFISFLEEPIIKYSVLILVTLLIIFIEKIDTSVLEVFDLSIFKIVYALLIAYTACFDPIYAIILTTFLIMAIQELHNRRTKNAIATHKLSKITNSNDTFTHNFIPSQIDNSNKKISKQSVVYDSMPEKDTLIKEIDNYLLQYTWIK